MTVTPPPPSPHTMSDLWGCNIGDPSAGISNLLKLFRFISFLHYSVVFSFTSLALSSFLFFLLILFSSSLLPFLFISFPFVHYLLPFLYFIPLSPFLYFFLFSKLARNSADRNAIPNPRRPHLLTESGCRIEETEPKRLSDRQSPSSSLRRTE